MQKLAKVKLIYLLCMFKETKKAFSNIFIGFTKTLKLILNVIKQCFDDIKNFKRSFYNLYETNLNLGVYHLESGNIRDAIIRFRIMTVLFSKHELIGEVYKWLVWSYFIAEKENKAIYWIKKNNSIKEEELFNLVTNRELETKLEKIPLSIIKKYNNITARYYDRKYYNRNLSLSNVFVKDLLVDIKEYNSKLNILEIGSGVGIIGNELYNYIDRKKYTITAIESSIKRIKIAKKTGEYSRVLEQDIEEFLLSNTKENFDLIICFLSLTFLRSNTKILKDIKNILANKGYLALLMPISDVTVRKSVSFTYSQNDLYKDVEKANYNIISKNQYNLNKNRYEKLLLQKNIIEKF